MAIKSASLQLSFNAQAEAKIIIKGILAAYMRYRCFLPVVVPSLCLLLSAMAVPAAIPAYAPIMPLASRSLLLDITAAGSRLVAVGERGHILYSDDRGRDWLQARVPTTQMLTSVFFIDGKHGWAAGHDGLILASDDGGENWRVQRDGLAVQHQANIELRETAHRKLEELSQDLETASGETRAQLEPQLEDARADLEDTELALEEALFTSPLMDVWFQDSNRGWAVGAFGTLVFTGDGGQHWATRAQDLDNPDEFHLNTITGDGRGRVFIAGEGGAMFRSVDGGQTWETLASPYDGSWFGSVYDARHQILLVFGLRGTLYRSADFGTTWEPLLNDSTSTLAGGSTSADGAIVLAGGGGTVLSSTDGGLSFQRTILPGHHSLSAGLSLGPELVLVGQGGVELFQGARNGR